MDMERLEPSQRDTARFAVQRERALREFNKHGSERGSSAWIFFHEWMQAEERYAESLKTSENRKQFVDAQVSLSLRTALFYHEIEHREAAIDAFNNAWHHAFYEKHVGVCWFCEAWLLRLGSNVYPLDEALDIMPKYKSVLDSENLIAVKIRRKILRTN